MVNAYYDPLKDKIYNCDKYSFVWFHEKGHQNQFKQKWVMEWDKSLYKYPFFYFLWNQLLEIDANLYALVKWCLYHFSRLPKQ